MSARNSDSLFWETTLSNRLPQLMRAIDDMIQFLGAHNVRGTTLLNAQLAVEEMGTNIIKYGFDEPSDHLIVLRALCTPDAVELTLVDDGHAFDPRTTPDPNPEAALEDRTPGGWGISLVRRLVSEMHYERAEEKNVLTLRIARERTAK